MGIKLFFTILMCFMSLSSFAGALEDDLSKNSYYLNLKDKIKNDDQLNTGTTKLQQAIEEQRRINEDPTAKAKLFYENEVSQEPCSHCPKYLSLIQAVNQIVEKNKIDDLAADNRQLIQLTKLKFLYYNALTTLDNGSVQCTHQSGMDYFSEKQFQKGKLSLAVEKALALPDVKDVQYYSAQAKEVHYFYRGEGEQSDVVIEVVMGKGQKPIIRYYKYDNGFNLPSSLTQNNKADKDNYIDFRPGVKTQNTVLPTDITFGKAGSKFNLAEDINLRFETNGSYNQQGGKVSFETDKGTKYLILEGTNVTNGSKGVNSVVNYSYNVDENSGLGINSSVETNLKTSTVPDKIIDRSHGITLSLTDHDSEYFKVKGQMDEIGAQNVEFSNNVKLGAGKAGLDYSLDRDLNQSVGLKASGYGYGETGVKYKNLKGGEQVGEAYWKTEIAKDLNLNLQTSYSTDKKTSVGLGLERRLRDNESMTLSVSHNRDQGYTLMYQMSFKF